MKQFNLEEYLKNPEKRVVTREGRSARIICTDAKGKHPIIALIDGKDGSEVIYSFNRDGRAVKGTQSQDDLFFSPKRHEGWVNIYRDATIGDIPFYKYIYPSEEEAKRNSGPGVIATTKIEWEE